MRALLVAALLAAAAAARAADEAYWREAGSGWFWYELPPPPPPPESDPAPAAKEEQAPAAAAAEEEEAVADEDPALAAHRRLQRAIEDRRAIAVMDPSPANVRAYLLVQQEALDRAAAFADVWQRLVWTAPELDETLRGRPVNAAALPAWDAARDARREAAVRALAADHGLFFLFGPDCVACAQMAAALARVEERYGLRVQAVAVAGARHPAFPAAWPDNGFAARLGARAYPALVLARLTAKEPRLIPLGYGPLAAGEIAERIEVLAAAPPPGARF